MSKFKLEQLSYNPLILNDNIPIDGIINMEIFLYQSNLIKYSIYGAQDWRVLPNNQLELNYLLDLYANNIYYGKFDTKVNLYKDIIGQYEPGSDINVHEVSISRTEIRVQFINFSSENEIIFNDILNYKSLNNSARFEDLYDTQGNAAIINDPTILNVNTDIVLNFGSNIKYTAINWVKDPVIPNSIIFKLTEPLADSIVQGNNLKIVVPLINEISDTINIHPGLFPQDVVILKSPNYYVPVQQERKPTTDYQSWNDVLSTNPTSSVQLIKTWLSASNININVDYTDFNNFVYYSNAEQRLNNFIYKVKLIEQYDGYISTLNTMTSGAYGIDNNITEYLNKKQLVLSGFDGYEDYLYYQSNSINDYTSSTYPKSNTTSPYTLYSTTSSQYWDWYNTQLESAQDYDSDNLYSLKKQTPLHILEDENSDTYVVFIDMIAQHFDIIWLYIKNMVSLYSRDEALKRGISQDLLFTALKSLGWTPEDGNQYRRLWESLLIDDMTGVTSVNSDNITFDEQTKEIWKRILNNLPYLLKNKGTEDGVRALINCYGIPSTILKIKEYGGSEPSMMQGVYRFDDFHYTLYLSGSQYIETDYAIDGDIPNAIEFRFKPANTTSSPLMTIINNYSVKLEYTAVDSIYANVNLIIYGTSGNSTTTLSNVPLFNGYWWNVYFGSSEDVTTANTTATTYDIKLYSSFNGETINHHSSSVIVGGATALLQGLKDTLQDTTHHILFGTNQSTYFTGNINEIRRWVGHGLNDTSFKNHCTYPKAYNGDDTTDAYDYLLFRLPLGTDGKTYNHYLTSSLSSSQPNQLIDVSTGSLYGFANEDNYIQVYETYAYNTPDLSGNRISSNKIRIETTTTSGQLNRDSSIVTSSADLYPTDNAKLGIYFSPTAIIDEDIASQYGGFRIDNYIGDYGTMYSQSYDALIEARNDYFKKYTSAPTYRDFYRLMSFFDGTLFHQIKKMVPARAKLLTGYVIEPHVLERSKSPYISNAITHEREDLDSNIDIYNNMDIYGEHYNITSSFETPLIEIESYKPIYYTGSVVDFLTIDSIKETLYEGEITYPTISSSYIANYSSSIHIGIIDADINNNFEISYSLDLTKSPKYSWNNLVTLPNGTYYSVPNPWWERIAVVPMITESSPKVGSRYSTNLTSFTTSSTNYNFASVSEINLGLPSWEVLSTGSLRRSLSEAPLYGGLPAYLTLLSSSLYYNTAVFNFNAPGMAQGNTPSGLALNISIDVDDTFILTNLQIKVQTISSTYYSANLAATPITLNNGNNIITSGGLLETFGLNLTNLTNPSNTVSILLDIKNEYGVTLTINSVNLILYYKILNTSYICVNTPPSFFKSKPIIANKYNEPSSEIPNNLPLIEYYQVNSNDIQITDTNKLKK